MTQSIGGYFELPEREKGVFPHSKGILLNTGRNALEYILRSIGLVKKVYLPYYTCDAVLEPLQKLSIPVQRYQISSSLEILESIQPKEGEYIIANNYFGIKDDYVSRLSQEYNTSLIVDAAQALLSPVSIGIKAFYSPRKFVGVADGGIAYLGDNDNYISIEKTERTDEHDSHLTLRKRFGAEAGFMAFREDERKLDRQPIRFMSKKTQDILSHIEYQHIRKKRRDNFIILHQALKDTNRIIIPDISVFTCPMIYPYLPSERKDLRKKLIEHRIYVAQYWPNMALRNASSFESVLAEELLALPCDQRYGIKEMSFILECLRP